MIVHNLMTYLYKLKDVKEVNYDDNERSDRTSNDRQKMEFQNFEQYASFSQSCLNFEVGKLLFGLHNL